MSSTYRKILTLVVFAGVLLALPLKAEKRNGISARLIWSTPHKHDVQKKRRTDDDHTRNDKRERRREVPVGRTRGYVTSPDELKQVADQAERRLQPFADAVLSIKNYANTGSASVRPSDPNPEFWPFGSISGDQRCAKPQDPAFLGDGAPLIEAKAIVYHLTGDARYAADVRKHILEISTTSGYNGDQYSGANKCILNLSWFVPSWIIAADLIEGAPGWTSADKRAFQDWLAMVVYRKVDWASDEKVNNWGAAGSAAAGMIGDYLFDSGIDAIDREGKKISPRDAYDEAKRRQLDRMNGNSYMNTTGCPKNRGQGIRPDGGIPWELVRGSSGCDARWVVDPDHSWTYMITSITAMTQHAELLWRRGDDSIYENLNKDGSGSLLKAIHFVIHNPNDPSRSLDWKKDHEQALEFMYRYLAEKGKPDQYIAEQLRIGKKDRALSTVQGRELYFGTLLQAFEPGTTPARPHVISPPGSTVSASADRNADK